MTTEKMRAEFEEWAKLQGLSLTRQRDSYKSNLTHRTFVAWQAALAQRQPAPGQSELASAKSEVDRLAWVLLAAFQKAEPEHGISKHPTSYMATFADLARAALAHHGRSAGVEAGEAARPWRPIGLAPRDGSWFEARTPHGRVRVVHFDQPDDRFPIDHTDEAWSIAPTEWRATAPQPPAASSSHDAGKVTHKLWIIGESLIRTGTAPKIGRKIHAIADALRATSDTVERDRAIVERPSTYEPGERAFTARWAGEHPSSVMSWVYRSDAEKGTWARVEDGLALDEDTFRLRFNRPTGPATAIRATAPSPTASVDPVASEHRADHK